MVQCATPDLAGPHLGDSACLHSPPVYTSALFPNMLRFQALSRNKRLETYETVQRALLQLYEP